MLTDKDKYLISNITNELEDHQKTFLDFIIRNKIKISPFLKFGQKTLSRILEEIRIIF